MIVMDAKVLTDENLLLVTREAVKLYSWMFCLNQDDVESACCYQILRVHLKKPLTNKDTQLVYKVCQNTAVTLVRKNIIWKRHKQRLAKPEAFYDELKGDMGIYSDLLRFRFGYEMGIPEIIKKLGGTRSQIQYAMKTEVDFLRKKYPQLVEGEPNIEFTFRTKKGGILLGDVE